MIDFWIAAGALLLVALAFLLLPILRGRRAQAEEDRTALNVALYEERLAELISQHSAGTLTDEQRSEEHTSELQSLMRISYAVFCLKKKKNKYNRKTNRQIHKRTT